VREVYAMRNVVQNRLLRYRVALNFCGSLMLRMGDFLCFARTNFCDWEKLVFLAGK